MTGETAGDMRVGSVGDVVVNLLAVGALDEVPINVGTLIIGSMTGRTVGMRVGSVRDVVVTPLTVGALDLSVGFSVIFAAAVFTNVGALTVGLGEVFGEAVTAGNRVDCTVGFLDASNAPTGDGVGGRCRSWRRRTPRGRKVTHFAYICSEPFLYSTDSGKDGWKILSSTACSPTDYPH